MSAEGYRCFFSVCVVSACVRGVLDMLSRLVMIRAATGGVFRTFAVVSGSFEAFLMRVFMSLSRAAAVLLQLFGVFYVYGSTWMTALLNWWLCVIAACSASCCTRLLCVQR